MYINYRELVVFTITYNFLQVIVLVNRIPFKEERVIRLRNYGHGQFLNARSLLIVLLARAQRVFGLQERSLGESCRLLSTLQVFHT